jgi:exopolysaccharide/PEP-CTERM locus tyrosine autokinase
MSIIEKAVNALGKGDQKGGSTGSSSAEDAPTSTVERTAQEMNQPEGADDSAAAESYGHAETQRGADAASPTTGGGSNYVKLDLEALRSIGILTPTVPRSTIAEEFRTIKRPLLLNISGDDVTPPIKQGNLIMVTSALEGDGKTFTSISLAMSIAMEQDKTVLFVDADTAKAEAGRIMGIPSDTPGLIDVLEDPSVKLSDVILHTNIEKLRILPAGDLHTHANELLASGRMHALMVELSEYYADRVIVFDSPPLLLTTEASVLANFMGQIVFVVSADRTPQHAVNEAVERIGEDKMVGMVLNRSRRSSTPYSYAYGSGYGSPYGYGRHRERGYRPEDG